uniref:starch synthase n=1 Tax=Sorghum bicolor TaxID=4558 RepID=B2Z9Y1_SORBI|nr:starch synthase IIIa precursor [Sorghum bicolor]
MEMALRSQSPLCLRSGPVFVVRPTAAGGGATQPLLRPTRFVRRRIIQRVVASPGCPNRKSRTNFPNVKVAAFSNYAPRLLVESSSKKSEHHDSRHHEETIDTFNGLSGSDVAESSNRDVEIEVDLQHNASSNSASREVYMAEEVDPNMSEEELPGNVLINMSSGEMETMDDAEVEEDKFELKFSGVLLRNAAVSELNPKDEHKAKEDVFVVDSSGTALDNAAVEEVVDEAEVEEDMVDVDILGLALNDVTMEEMDLMDREEALQENFDVNSPGNASSGGMYSGVDELGKPPSTSMDGIADNETRRNLKPVPLPIVRYQEQEKIVLSIVEEEGLIVGSCEEGQAVVDYHKQEENSTNFDEQKQLTDGFPDQGIYIVQFPKQNNDTVGSPKFLEQKQEFVGSYKQDRSIIGLHEHDQSIVGVPQQIQYIDQSIAGSHKQDESIASAPEKIQSVGGYIKPNQSIVGSCRQHESIIVVPEKIQSIISYNEIDQSIVGSHKQDKSVVSVPEQTQSIVSYSTTNQSTIDSYRQVESIIGVPEKVQSIISYDKLDKSIVGSHKQDESIVSVPEKIQSIVGYSKPDQSIVGLPKQQHSIVHIDERKQSIVGFPKQDLSIIGISKESQTMQLATVGTHDGLLMKGVEAKETSQKTEADTLQAEFYADNLLQKHKEGFTKETDEITLIEKINDEDLMMIEEEKSIGMEDQMVITEEDIPMAKVEIGIDKAKFLHVLSEEESSWDENEVGIIEDEEQYEVDETSMSTEQDIQESPNDNVDPQALQRMLQELAEKNSSLGNKLFAYPEVLKADSTIDLYFNRDLSAVANEPDVLIKGAFNGWKWKFFTEKLHKSELGGGWWCCKLYIPKQAYRMDFVFFNGRTLYENNDNNDFVIQIESTMDENLFEDFLAEEKQRELEKLANEEAERRRQTEEQRRREEERAADKADRAQAKVELEMKKKKLHNVLGLARASVDNLWYIEPIATGQGATIRLYYNINSRPLVHSTEIWMHGGYNNWIDGLSFSERLVHHNDKDSDWCFADVVLPERTYVLDWVFADGPPGNARNYDNNGGHDFHATLPNNMTVEEYWMEEEQRIYTRLQQERREREEAIKRKAERNAKMKAEMKEKTMRMFLVSQKHIVYTEPLEIRAGTTVDVLYNPSNTVLTGKPEVWFRCSFNRWMYPGGVLPPQKMVQAENGSHLKVTVYVLQDTYMMDFVSSESEEGGIYDNRNGLDYHIPVFGSIAKEPPMHIVHIAVEMAPIAKVGGLGDVVTSLSRAVQDLGHNVEVILPKHDCLNLSNVKNLHIHQSFSWGGSEIKVWRGLVEGLCVYFLEPQNGMFGVGCVYGRNDDRRFGFFCHSALEFLLQSRSSPNIIHCHDWSSAPVAWLYKENYAESSLANARVVFTIHNLEFGAHYIGKAMKYCDKATTVSNSYSREVSGHSAIVPHLGKFYGILNGIDPDIWDPYNDNFIPVHYTSENVIEGKRAAKKALQQKFGLQQIDVPIVGIVTRLTAQKGIHLIKHAIHRTLERNGQVVLLGSAPDPRIQADFVNLANTLHGVNHGQVRMSLTYDEPLSHLIYAGSDFILVPSIFEPCGLTQLVAMRYGTIPIVRKTGGLFDTVFDVDNDKERARARGLDPNGFSFDGADSKGVDYALNRAISAWFDARSWFHSLCKRVMEQDWSWNRPALDYIELYRSASKL